MPRNRNIALAIIAVISLLLVGCSSDSQRNTPGEPASPRDGNTGAIGDTPDRPGRYITSNTGTTDSHHSPDVPGNGAAK